MFLGVIYEAVRFMRCLFSPTSRKCNGARAVIVAVFSFLSDFLFLLLFAVCGILITFEMCGGVFRGIVYIGMAGGMLIYRITLGRITSKTIEWLARLVKCILRGAVRILAVPFRFINFLFVRFYALTIGKIIGRIKERVLVKRLTGIFLEDLTDKGNAVLPFSEKSCEKGYKKEGRVSFGGKKVT